MKKVGPLVSKNGKDTVSLETASTAACQTDSTITGLLLQSDDISTGGRLHEMDILCEESRIKSKRILDRVWSSQLSVPTELV